MTQLPTTCACGAPRSGIQENRFAFECGTIAIRGARWKVRATVLCYLRRIWA